jgi:hypothetical protein
MSDIMNKVATLFERDQARQFVAVTADDLPLSYDDVTDQWLTAVLCKNVPGAAVVSHRLGEVDDGSSNRRRISVVYNEAGQAAGLPAAFFCKATHGFTNRVLCGVSGALQSETVFYNRLRPLLDIEAPVGYYANYDPDSFNSMIMLGDITDTVTEFCSHHTVVTRARAESQLKLLAKMHGSGYADPRVRKELKNLGTFTEFFENTQRFGLKDGASKGFLDAEHVIPPRLFSRVAEIWPATVAAAEVARPLPATLIHGDVHLKNWYVAGNGEMGLGDWQCTSNGHWGRDVAYTMSTSLSTEDRRAWEQDLLKFYLENLARAGGPTVDFAEAWTHYRQQLPSVLAWWTVTLSPPPGMPDCQPADITLEFIRRISVAMDDVDSLHAFQQSGAA